MSDAAELRHRANNAACAQRAYNGGRPGFYAVTNHGWCAVAGPYSTRAGAADVARRRNAEETVAANPLIVMEVLRDAPTAGGK